MTNQHSATPVQSASAVKSLVLTALMTAITCIIAPFVLPVPFSPVPISLTNLILYISIFILGWKSASASYIIYLLLGAVGLPVFSGFSGGLGKIAGPTGGYLVGFIFLILISGSLLEKFRSHRLLIAAVMILGTIVAYIFGTAWLCFQMNLTLMQGLAAGVLPYIPGDCVKIIIALIIGPVLSQRIKSIQ